VVPIRHNAYPVLPLVIVSEQNIGADMNVKDNGWPIDITTFVKVRGPLTKRIWLGQDGTFYSDGSDCVMWKGRAYRTPLPSLDAFAAHIGALNSNEAIALGSLHADLPDRVKVVTKADLTSVNGPRHLT
jgi:hypothetical protein